ncbi:MAG TPA: polyphosphate kinase 2 family protein [Acidimicrobiales bacterium]|jgi:PPK2 family polyphosphate:nucleotide phosphotransferase|nr:polyphosphate kinase 2 family protein [Acidimicrobiales bacterium]HRA35411.1 polyphosphate kinase 2 family protein [Acidimicrobiales bacterium]
MADERHRWVVGPGSRPDLDGIDPDGTPGAPGSKAELETTTEELVFTLADLQNRLWAESRRSVLLVLQALDAGGKDGTIRKVFTGVNPQGVRVTSFKAPTPDELAHDFLWRIHARTPAAGEIGVFNRSHYEDVLVVRVEDLVAEPVWRARYAAIRHFEDQLAASGTTIVKVYLHISAEEQARRFRSRLTEPAKRWKFSSGDLEVRAKWDQYREAYLDAIEETSTKAAPWYVVPADQKKYRNWAVLQILVATLQDMDPQFPEPSEDLDGIVIE